MYNPSVLDHLVPAFSGDAYGASLDELPLNVSAAYLLYRASARRSSGE